MLTSSLQAELALVLTFASCFSSSSKCVLTSTMNKDVVITRTTVTKPMVDPPSSLAMETIHLALSDTEMMALSGTRTMEVTHLQLQLQETPTTAKRRLSITELQLRPETELLQLLQHQARPPCPLALPCPQALPLQLPS